MPICLKPQTLLQNHQSGICWSPIWGGRMMFSADLQARAADCTCQMSHHLTGQNSKSTRRGAFTDSVDTSGLEPALHPFTHLLYVFCSSFWNTLNLFSRPWYWINEFRKAWYEFLVAPVLCLFPSNGSLFFIVATCFQISFENVRIFFLKYSWLYHYMLLYSCVMNTISAVTLL